MGNEVLAACPLFITDPVTGEQREVKPIGDIGWTEIQPASDSSVKELADALKKSADATRQVSNAITGFSFVITKLNIPKLLLLLGINPRRYSRQVRLKAALKQNRTRKKQRLTRLQRRQRRQKR